MFDVALNWEKCPEGVEVHDYGDHADRLNQQVTPFGVMLGIHSPDDLSAQWKRNIFGLWYRCRSPRRAAVPINSVQLDRAVVLEFLNARDAVATAAFFASRGMLDDRDEVDAASVDYLKDKLVQAVVSSHNMPEGERAGYVNGLLKLARLTAEMDFSGPKQSARTVFYPDTLLAFMVIEAAFAVTKGVGIARCANCDDLMFVGAAADRRSDAKTCSDRCRSALRRKNATASA